MRALLARGSRPWPRLTNETLAAPRQHYLDLQPVSAHDRQRAPAGLEEHLEPGAAARGAGAWRYAHRRLLDADDVDRMLDALVALGVPIERADGAKAQPSCMALRARFRSSARRSSLAMRAPPFRPLTAALAFSRRQLPALRRAAHARASDRRSGRRARALGADIRYAGHERLSAADDRPGPCATEKAIASPVAVRGDVSSQFLSALLMAAAAAGSRSARSK